MRPDNLSFVSIKFHGDQKTQKVEVSMTNFSFRDNTGCKTVVSVYLSVMSLYEGAKTRVQMDSLL